MSPWIAAYALACKRRLALLMTGKFEPYPTPPKGLGLSPSEAHFADCDAAPLKLAWPRAAIAEPTAWQERARAKLVELLGYERSAQPPSARHLSDSRLPGGFLRRRAYLERRPHHHIPVDLVWAQASATPMKVMLCIQGTNSGAHLSWGEVRMPADPVKIANGLDFARQAARRGYLAVCIEQSCFGERRERKLNPRSADPCIDAANHALLLGRTLLGERVSDTSAVIDWLEAGGTGLDIDSTVVHAMGNSAGGTTIVFAAAVDQRIAAIMAGSCVGFIRETIARRRDPAGQNTIPGILNWLEFDDVIGLIAPRVVLTVAGTGDHIFPAQGAQAVVEEATKVYEALGAPESLRAAAAEGPHRFYPEVAWPAFEEMLAARAKS